MIPQPSLCNSDEQPTTLSLESHCQQRLLTSLPCHYHLKEKLFLIHIHIQYKMFQTVLQLLTNKISNQKTVNALLPLKIHNFKDDNPLKNKIFITIHNNSTITKKTITIHVNQR